MSIILECMPNECKIFVLFLHWYSTLGPQEAFLWWEWRGRGGGLSKNVGHFG